MVKGAATGAQIRHRHQSMAIRENKEGRNRAANTRESTFWQQYSRPKADCQCGMSGAIQRPHRQAHEYRGALRRAVLSPRCTAAGVNRLGSFRGADEVRSMWSVSLEQCTDRVNQPARRAVFHLICGTAAARRYQAKVTCRTSTGDALRQRAIRSVRRLHPVALSLRGELFFQRTAAGDCSRHSDLICA